MTADLRRYLDLVTGLVSKVNSRRTFGLPPGDVRLNLGSGITVAPGWVNIDVGLAAMCAGWPPALLRLIYPAATVRRFLSADDFVHRLKSGTFIHADLSRRIPLSDASVDIVYTAHFVEHLYRVEAERLFEEVWRVLRPGGIFRVNVPSLEVALQRFEEGKTEEGLAEFFPRSSKEERRYDRHRYLYDFPLLERMLRATGFAEIVRRQRAEGAVPDLELFEQRPTGLYVEATKPIASTGRSVSGGNASNEPQMRSNQAMPRLDGMAARCSR